MKVFLKLFRILYVIYALAVFIIIMLLVLPFAFLSSFAGKIKGGNLLYSMCGIWADCWLFLIGIWHKNIYITPLHKEHPVIFVANHISYLDIPVIMKSIRQPMRVLGKVEMSRIPVFGYIYSLGAVMVDRSSSSNRSRSVLTLKSYLRKGISIFIFPEGTFNETGKLLKSFYDGAFRIAIETQTPIKPVVFPDTHKRLHYKSIFTLSPGISRAVFLEEIPVEGLELKDVSSLKALVYKRMEECLMSKNYE